MEIYDLVIIGTGVAGVFAAYKIAKEHKDIKTIIFELGRPNGKRRRQCEGYFGLFPNSDGKLYLNDVKTISNIVGTRRANSSHKQFTNIVENIMKLNIIEDKSPNQRVAKNIKNAGFELKLNNYIQLYPKDVHLLSKHTASKILEAKHIDKSFDDEVISIEKNKNTFTVISQNKNIQCKKIILCVGRSGWRWAKKVYDKFGIIENNDVANFGIRIESSSSVMKDFNKSNCSISNIDMDLGPLCWSGTVIPEDHVDFAISSFRSNESRWKTDKVSFNLIGHRLFKDTGFEQTSRIGQLTFVLSNDRVIKEKLSTLVARKSKISMIKEYDWLVDALVELEKFMPEITSKGYFHMPTILPLVPKVNLGDDLSTEVGGLHVAGESAGISGLLAAAVSGLAAVDGACR